MRRRNVLKSAVSAAGLGFLGNAAATTGAAGDATYTQAYYDDRLYWKFLPSGIDDGGRVPLVVMLHGCGQSPDQFREETRMNRLAEAETFAVVYPDQTTDANADECWNWFRDEHTTRGNGEAALITGMARETVAEHAIDPKRVCVAGLSAGAAMVPNLLAAYPDVYAAGGVHSGLEYDVADNALEGVAAMETGGPDPQRKGTQAYEAMVDDDVVSEIPTVVLHGTDDVVVQPVNGHQAVEQATQTIDLAIDGEDDDDVDYEADETRTGSAAEYDYTVSEYHGKGDEPLVEKWMVHGMGHGWSGGSEGGEDTEPGGPDANRALWTFFERHTSDDASLEKNG